MDYEKLTKAIKTMTPEQIQSLMEEFANAIRAEQPQQIPPQSADPGMQAPEYQQPHPTQTPGAVMRRQMMQQPMGMLNRQ